MRLIVVRDKEESTKTAVLRYALSSAPLAEVISHGLETLACARESADGVSGRVAAANTVWLIPGSWQGSWPAGSGRRIVATDSAGVKDPIRAEAAQEPWLVISSGRFAADLSAEPLRRVLERTDADVVAVTARPPLLAYREHVRLTGRGDLVGYRRLFRDSAEPAPMPADWPHHLYVRTQALDRVLDGGLPTAFGAFLERLRSRQVAVEAVAVAGSVADLESAEGLMAFCRTTLAHLSAANGISTASYGRQTFLVGGRQQVAPQARFIGPVLLGDNVCVEADAVIIGPSVLCAGSVVRAGALVEASILGTGATVQCDQTLRDVLVMPPAPGAASAFCVLPRGTRAAGSGSSRQGVFRTWPRFSYAGCWKRVVDIVAAAVVLILFAPLIPFIALAIKINSPGPVFYKDKRQGLHGRSFHCVKFRTMRVGAAEIQDKLRFVSEVDGPQFKMADDPRISAVGRFLRETYLDEIPQFFNVLIGQMSLVGPRPSPESENTLCPWWRDARLSVRPGISGLWQVFRTREAYKDFQEWIYYDTQYVQGLSARMDLWVCWCTFKKMVDSFIRQF